MLAGLPASALLLVVVAACGSSGPVTKTVSVPAVTTPPATTINTATSSLTPNTSTIGTTATASCGSVAGGFAYQITGTGVSCSTAQAVANAYVHSIQGSSQNGQGAVTVSAANTQFSCTSAQGQTATVSCDAPGNQGVVQFKTHT